jgi:O-antigen chain-terminating methyltransferase
VKIVNPDYTVEKIVQRMKEAARNAPLPSQVGPTLPLTVRDELVNADGTIGDLDIPELELQPRFRPNNDDHYHVNDLLKFNGDNFLQNAYRAILKRPADEVESAGFMEGLRSGDLNKIDVLSRLLSSPEGRSKNVQIDGLGLPATLRKTYRLPIIGYFINLLVAIGRLPVQLRNQRQFEEHALAQQEILARHINHSGNQLKHAGNQLNHFGNQLKHLGNQLVAHTNEVGKQLLADLQAHHELVLKRIDELNKYYEDRLNEEAAERQSELWTLGKQLGKAASEWKQELESARTAHDEAMRAQSERIGSLTENLDLSAHQLVRLGKEVDAELKAMREKQQQIMMELALHGRRFSRWLQDAENRLPIEANASLDGEIRKEETHALDSFFASFDEQFRGSRDEIKERLKIYLKFLQDLPEGPIIDVGCGRGEWLELLNEQGLAAIGVDSNIVLVDQGRQRGLDIIEGELIQYLSGLDEASVAAITGFHIVEHLPIDRLVTFLTEALRVLKTGGVIILETPNPRNVLVGTCNFYFDPTHRNPIPSEVLQFLVDSRGFTQTQILPLNPSDEMPVPGESELVTRFNQYFYGPMDYGLVGWKPAPRTD